MNNLGALFEARSEIKVRSFSRLTFETDFASHLLDQLGRNHETEPGAAEAPAGGSFRLDKRLEQASLRLERNSDSRVYHLETYNYVVSRVFHFRSADRHVASFGELDRICHQVVKNLAQPIRISAQSGRHIGVDIQRKLDTLGVSGDAEGIDQCLGQLNQIKIEPLEHDSACREFREVQDVVDDREQQLAARSNDLDQAALFGSQYPSATAARRCR